jgi:CheY-like chemotaxis protein
MAVACRSVLIVEDDEDIREALQVTLESVGYKVASARNGKEGLELLTSNPMPGLILLDLMMPVMNGWSFAEALEHNTMLSAIPVVVVTAYAEEAGSLKHARSFIKKPVDVALLLNVVRQYCNGCNGQHARRPS